MIWHLTIDTIITFKISPELKINKEFSPGSTIQTQEPPPITRYYFRLNFWKNFFKPYMVTTQTIQALRRCFKKPDKITITHVLLNTLKNGLPTAKFAYKPNELTMISLERNFSTEEWDLGPEDILQMDILPNLPPRGGYDHIITAIDVFSRYLFAYPATRITASAVARVIMDILCKHTDLPTTIITDLGTQFNAQVTMK